MHALILTASTYPPQMQKIGYFQRLGDSLGLTPGLIRRRGFHLGERFTLTSPDGRRRIRVTLTDWCGTPGRADLDRVSLERLAGRGWRRMGILPGVRVRRCGGRGRRGE